jgi:hypothetical protein
MSRKQKLIGYLFLGRLKMIILVRNNSKKEYIEHISAYSNRFFLLFVDGYFVRKL